ncbi:hypothetical protein LMG33810_000959 [Carnimonas sp. LMG 33810]
MQTATLTGRHWLAIVIGLLSVYLMLSLGACAPQPVYKTIPAPQVQVPAELTQPLERPNCLFQSNANLGDCILQQAGVIERANADRAAIRRILERQ